MTLLLSFLLVLTVSKELLYFNEELLVIISFILFLTVVAISVGSAVGSSIDASILEVTGNLSSKISEYNLTLGSSREVLIDQLFALSKHSSITLVSLSSALTTSEKSFLKESALNRLLNVALARSFSEKEQLDTQINSPVLQLRVSDLAQPGLLPDVTCSVENTCLVTLPTEPLVLVIINSLIVEALR